MVKYLIMVVLFFISYVCFGIVLEYFTKTPAWFSFYGWVSAMAFISALVKIEHNG